MRRLRAIRRCRTAIGMSVVACGVLLLPPDAVAAPSASPTTAVARPAMAGKWEVGGFDRQGEFSFSPAHVVPGVGVGFEFLNRPDTAFLLTDHPAHRRTLLTDLTGVTLTAQASVNVSAGSLFTYFGQSDASADAASVRFYFATDTPLGVICPCGDIGLSSVWVSDRVHVDLETLDGGTVTFNIDMDPAEWIDLESNHGNVDAAHLSYFARAAADVDTIGLTFGGGGSPFAGVGIADGSGTGSFHLQGFTATR
jgi:hypothetical protein